MEASINNYKNVENIDSINILLSMKFALGREFDYPREESIDRIVTKCLIGSSKENPITIQEISNRLETLNFPTFRQIIIDQSLNRLINKKHVEVKEERPLRVFISDKIQEQTKNEIGESKIFLNKCTQKIISRITNIIDPITTKQIQQIEEIFKYFIMETFARLGYQCGRLISGKYLGKDFVDSNQILQIFNDLFRKYNIKDNKLQQKLKENFCRFFIELDPDFQKLKFHLAQNFYILKLLGINQESQLLSKNAFAGSEIYLDTNVVLASFLSESKPYQAFREFHKISNEIDIKTYVTSITRNEVTDVVAYQKQISNTYNNIPESKQAKIRNRFYQTYRKNKELDSKYSINDLFDPFENLKENLQNFFGIPLIYENIYNELLLDNKEFVDIKAKIQKISLEKRRREKSPNALTHDAFHYKLITTKREENPKTWLLTLDTSLPLVSEILLGSETRPYCFTLDNWLQCISPFVTTETELADFSFIFSNVFGLGLLPAEQIYDIEDFVMFSDLEVDIKLMPEPIVDQTVSFIRNEILKGRIYNKDILKESSYRLQKYLINLTSKYRENEFLSNELGISKEKIKTLESSLQTMNMTINEIQTELTNEKKKTLELSEKIKNEEDLRLKSKKAMRYKIKIVTASIIWLVAILLVTIPWIKYNILPTSSFIRFVAPIFIIIAGFFIMFGKSKVMKIVSLVIGIAGFVKLLNELWRIIKNVK